VAPVAEVSTNPRAPPSSRPAHGWVAQLRAGVRRLVARGRRARRAGRRRGRTGGVGEGRAGRSPSGPAERTSARSSSALRWPRAAPRELRRRHRPPKLRARIALRAAAARSHGRRPRASPTIRAGEPRGRRPRGRRSSARPK
jgi:hypothetical protein